MSSPCLKVEPTDDTKRDDLQESAITRNAYGDLAIPAACVPADPDAFVAFLKEHLAAEKRGIWLTLRFDAVQSRLLPLAQELGFKLHHSYGDFLTLQAWVPSKPNPTPPYCHYAIGAAAFVINRERKVLAIRERFDHSGRYHVPGGHVDEAEDFITAAVREAREETGCVSRALGIAAFHELHLPFVPSREHAPSLTAEDTAKMAQSTRFGTAHLGVFSLCYASNDALAPDAEEIAEAKWVDLEDFFERAHDHEVAMLRALVTNGNVDAAARLAASTSSSSAAAAVAASEEDLAKGRSGLMTGLSAFSHHKRFIGSEIKATFLTGLPEASFVAGLDQTVAFVRADDDEKKAKVEELLRFE